MQKNDQSIYNIVSASINRHSMNIDTWEKTKFWNDGTEELNAFLSNMCVFVNGEIPILYFYSDQENWTVFSTRAIYYSNYGRKGKIAVGSMTTYDLDVTSFKAEGKTSFLEVTTKEGKEHKFLYETGKPSMGAIYATQTLIQIAY